MRFARGARWCAALCLAVLLASRWVECARVCVKLRAAHVEFIESGTCGIQTGDSMNRKHVPDGERGTEGVSPSLTFALTVFSLDRLLVRGASPRSDYFFKVPSRADLRVWVLGRIPLYYEIKLIGLLWLALPQTRGALKLFQDHKDKLDLLFQKAVEQLEKMQAVNPLTIPPLHSPVAAAARAFLLAAALCGA